MTEVSYFQIYSQRENHATNNTLLMLRHLYSHSPARFGALLGTLLESEIQGGGLTVGPMFDQQFREGSSVFDARIIQKPFQIRIEAKMGSQMDEDQFKKHVSNVPITNNDEEAKSLTFLLSLTTEKLSSNQIAQYQALGYARTISITYSQIVAELRILCRSHEDELCNIIDDYENFLQSNGLLSTRHDMMVAFPCGLSHKENIRFGIYYHDAGKSAKTGCDYLGFYTDKRIFRIGKIKGHAVYTINDGFPVRDGKTLFGRIATSDEENIKDIVEASKKYYPDLGQYPTRYYVLEDASDTNFIKSSPGGMLGHQYFKLSEYGIESAEKKNVAAIAAELSGKKFEDRKIKV